MAGDRGAVDDAAGRDVRAPARDDRVAHLGAGVQLVHDGVGRQRGGAQPGERRQRLGLAGADPAREGDERRSAATPAPRRSARRGLGRGGLGGVVERSTASSMTRPGSSVDASSATAPRRRRRRPRQAELRARCPGRRRRRPRPRPRAAASRRGRIWSSTRLIESDRRRRSESISRIFTLTSSPGWTISRGFSTCCWASSEMWTRPSTPSRISTNAPKATTLVTLPSSSSPTE